MDAVCVPAGLGEMSNTSAPGTTWLDPEPASGQKTDPAPAASRSIVCIDDDDISQLIVKGMVRNLHCK